MSRWDQPSKLRRMGREAYHNGAQLSDNPFTGDGQYAEGWAAEYRAPDWTEGWQEGKEQDEAERKRRRQEIEQRRIAYDHWKKEHGDHLRRFLAEEVKL